MGAECHRTLWLLRGAQDDWAVADGGSGEGGGDLRLQHAARKVAAPQLRAYTGDQEEEEEEEGTFTLLGDQFKPPRRCNSGALNWDLPPQYSMTGL